MVSLLRSTEIPMREVSGHVLEPYQDRISEQVKYTLVRHHSGAVYAPTASGKSLMIAATVEDALKLKKPVLILHPDMLLLRQNLARIRDIEGFATARIAVYIAQNETIDVADFKRDTLDADIILATNMSIARRMDEKDYPRQAQKFGVNKGTVLIDEGHRAGADKTSKALKILAREGAIGIIYTATPFRTDNIDPLSPFGVSVESDLIGVATYKEVRETGRTCATRFDLAREDFESHLDIDAISMIEETFMALIRANKSVDEASKTSFAQFFRSGAVDEMKAIGAVIVDAGVKVWRSRVGGRRLTMIHCDSVDFARPLSAAIAMQTFPGDHARAGEVPRVALIVADEILVWEANALQKDPKSRELVIHEAKSGAYDVLVNVNTLGTGTDVPITDLNMLFARQRCVTAFRQIAGRGERSHPGKVEQLFVDIGSSTSEIYRDIDAIKNRRPRKSRTQVRNLHPDICQQFTEWFDNDPNLRNQIDSRTKTFPIKEKFEKFETISSGYSDKIHKDIINTIPSSMPTKIFDGIYALANFDIADENNITKAAIFLEMSELNKFNLPHWLVNIIDGDVTKAYLCSSLHDARLIAGYHDVDNAGTEQNNYFAQKIIETVNHPKYNHVLGRMHAPVTYRETIACSMICNNNYETLRLSIAAFVRLLISKAMDRHIQRIPTLVRVIKSEKLTYDQALLLGAAEKLHSIFNEISPTGAGAEFIIEAPARTKTKHLEAMNARIRTPQHRFRTIGELSLNNVETIGGQYSERYLYIEAKLCSTDIMAGALHERYETFKECLAMCADFDPSTDSITFSVPMESILNTRKILTRQRSDESLANIIAIFIELLRRQNNRLADSKKEYILNTRFNTLENNAIPFASSNICNEFLTSNVRTQQNIIALMQLHLARVKAGLQKAA